MEQIPPVKITFTMDSIYDVIIVGAGPAGASCGFHLAGKGIKTLILEKSRFPREKFCAGAVPSSVFNIVPIDPRVCESIKLKKYFFSFRRQKKVTGKMNGDIFSVDRFKFDFSLAKEAQQAGAELIENSSVLEVIRQDELIVAVTADNRKYIGKVIAIANGGNSNIAKKLIFAPLRVRAAKKGICIYYEIEPGKDIMSEFANAVHLDFFFVKKGVAGILPKKNYIWVGIYTQEETPIREIQKKLDNFLESLQENFPTWCRDYKDRSIAPKRILKGLPIPLYNGRIPLSKDNIILLGEAARLVNPLSGEGIKPAMESGKIAAEEIEKHIREGKPLSFYSERIHKEIGEELERAARFSRIAFAFPEIAYDGMIHVADDAVRILNGELSYKNFEERLKAKIIRRIAGKFHSPQSPQSKPNHKCETQRA